MSTTAINSNTNSAAASSSQTLNQADFLKLLVTQMTSQDPLNPQSDTDFAAQLAQFSSLQETTNMAGYMQTLQADSMIGMNVNVASAANSAKQVSGVVSGVDISSGTPEISVNGEDYSLSQVSSITPATNQTAANSSASQ
jgi:flagellar basal-body rod modification protein FlgD